MTTNNKHLHSRIAAALTVAAALAFASPAMARTPSAHDDASAASAGTVEFTQSVYDVNEDAGQFPITITRSNDSGAETVGYGVTLKGSQAGTNFDVVPNNLIHFAPGQSTYTFNVTIHDQGIHGPMRFARAYLFGASPAPLGANSTAILDLLQNDPLDAKDPSNPLGYAQTPTDGDPLQFVQWYVFGNQSPAGAAARKYSSSDPSWASALQKIADTPGSGTYRFWMWNEPASTLARTVEKYLADAEQAQPNTTVALSTYSLVHGTCENPLAIEKRYQNWITQLASGIGNFRVVLYLEEDSLMETHCLTHSQIQVRLKDELAYAVKALSVDPHVLVYMDAGAPDGWLTARQTARDLEEADVAQAQGFFVNATHYDWTTTDIHYGQEIARLLGGKHFIVQTDDNGRGPLVPKDKKLNGNEDLCNPAGRGTGPLTWDTGYKYVDGLLWFNNPGNSDGTCGANDPPIAQFWAQYAVGLVDNGVSTVTGPHFNLATSQLDM